jgi:hypothetical protein
MNADTYVTAVFRPTTTIPSLAESLDNNSLAWSTGGDNEWHGLSDQNFVDGDAAVSGEVANYRRSYIETTVTGPGVVSYRWSVSSEEGFDFLRFFIDEQEQPGSISGEVAWVERTFAIGTGEHTLKWEYSKDPAVSEGKDAGFLDKVVFAGESSPEIGVLGNGLTIDDGDTTPRLTDHTDFGGADVAGETVSRTFTIANNGAAELNLTGTPRVTVSGDAASDFEVTTQPASPVAAAGSTAFTVQFDPSAGGLRQAILRIANDDSDENPYDFAIQGTGTAALDTDGDGIPDADDPDDDNDGIADWADPDPLDPAVGLAPAWPAETAAQVNQNWSFIDAPSGYLDAVVIAGPPTVHGADPGVVRLRNVTDTGFELRFQEWDYRARVYGDSAHMREDIPYLVLQPGRHTMSDGSVWEVGTFSLGGTGAWQGELFTQPFTMAPKLFLTVQTYNGNQAVSVRARNISADGFEAALYEEEALMDGHSAETIGYLAIASPAGGGLIALDGVQVPYLLQSFNGDERWSPVLSQRLKVEEEKSKDDEIDHGDETIDVLALGDQLLAQQVTSKGGDTTALRRLEPTGDAPMEWGMLRGLNHTWQVLPFAKSYTHPVLVAKPVSSNGADPGVIRIKDLKGDHAQLRYQEWDYLDGNHGAREDLFYLVSEAGSYQLGGLDVEADELTSNKLGRAGQWETISLGSLFPRDPAVFASVMSTNGADAVTTRIRNLEPAQFDPAQFELAMDEQESKSDGHATETLGWIAIERGTATTSEGRKLQVFFKQLNDQRTAVVYPKDTSHRYPTVVTDVDSTDGADPVVLRYVNPTNLQIELKLEEEKSKDSETSHALEDVGIFVGE